jgi:hypothetical protein
MRHSGCRYHAQQIEPRARLPKVLEETLAGAEQDGYEVDLHLVDEAVAADLPGAERALVELGGAARAVLRGPPRRARRAS